MNKQDLIDKIDREAIEWERFLDEVGEECMEQPSARAIGLSRISLPTFQLGER